MATTWAQKRPIKWRNLFVYIVRADPIQEDQWAKHVHLPTLVPPKFPEFFSQNLEKPQAPSFWRCRRAITIGSGLPTFTDSRTTPSSDQQQKRHQVLDPCRRDCGLQRALWGLSFLGGEEKNTSGSLWKVKWSCLLLLVFTHVFIFIFFWMPGCWRVESEWLLKADWNTFWSSG